MQIVYIRLISDKISTILKNNKLEYFEHTLNVLYEMKKKLKLVKKRLIIEKIIKSQKKSSPSTFNLQVISFHLNVTLQIKKKLEHFVEFPNWQKLSRNKNF